MKKISGIVIYDISVPKFRRALDKVLRNYGYRVQESVFEFSLSAKIYLEMVEKIRSIYKEYRKFKAKNILTRSKKSIIIYRFDLENKMCFDVSDLKNIKEIEFII